MSACIVVEEVAKVDPAVAVMVDIQNTLINNMLRCDNGPVPPPLRIYIICTCNDADYR